MNNPKDSEKNQSVKFKMNKRQFAFLFFIDMINIYSLYFVIYSTNENKNILFWGYKALL